MARLGRAQPVRRPFRSAVLSPVTAGPYLPTVMSTSGSGVSWANIDRAKTINASYASLLLTSGGPSMYIVATGFGFNIDQNRSVAGISVKLVDASALTAVATLMKLRLQKIVATGPRPIFRATTVTSANDYSVGGTFDTWSEPYLPAEINNPEFGVAISYEEAAVLTSFSVDAIQVTVYTTDTVLPATQYAPGTYNFGPTPLASGKSLLTFWVDTTLHTDPAVTITLDTEISYDNGSTWSGFVGGSRVGQASSTHPSGELDYRMVAYRTLADSGGNTQFRGSFTVAGDSLTTGVGVYAS